MPSQRNAAAQRMLFRCDVEVLHKAEQLIHHTVHWTGTAYFWIITWFATVMSTCFSQGEPSRSSNQFPDPPMICVCVKCSSEVRPSVMVVRPGAPR